MTDELARRIHALVRGRVVCVECGAPLVRLASGARCDACEDHALTEPDPNDCAECARSFGPHYAGPCPHGD